MNTKKGRDWASMTDVELALLLDGMESDITALKEAVEVLQAQEKKPRKHIGY